MELTSILLLISLGAKPVPLPVQGIGENRANRVVDYIPTIVAVCGEPGASKCREGRVEYRDGRLVYVGDVPINEAVQILVKQEESNWKRQRRERELWDQLLGNLRDTNRQGAK